MDDYSFQPAFVDSEIDAESNDDFDFLDPEGDLDDNWWTSDEEVNEGIREQSSGRYPKAKDWQKDPPDRINEVEVTVDKARQFIWKSAKTEIGIFRDVFGECSPSFETPANTTFGPNSKLFHLMAEEFEDHEIDMTHEVFCRFLATFHTASMLSVPAPLLCETSRVDTKDLIGSKSEFIAVFRAVETMGSGTEDDALWMKVEDCFNNMMKKMFLAKRAGNQLSIAIDDDKHHFNFSKSADTHGLKRARHAKANVTGHVCHTAGLSATGIPLCAMFEREFETSLDKHACILKKMFGSRSGNGAPNLRGLVFHSDRGHMKASLAFDKILPWGGDVVGTVARTFWCPFTFSKLKKSSSDAADDSDKHGRTNIPMKGHRDTKCRTLEWHNSRKVRATAHNSGTGAAVSLAMSSIHHAPVFDLNMAFPKDSKHCFDCSQSQASRDARAFRVVSGSADHMDCIRSLPIHPLATVQSDTSWFIMREFTLTSSTVDPMTKARASEIGPSHNMREHYEIILSVVGKLNILPSSDDNGNQNQGDDGSENDENEDSDDDDNEVGMNWVSNWIRRVNSGETAVFLLRLPSLDEQVIRGIVRAHDNSKPGAPLKTLRKQLKEWAECQSHLHRKHFWFKKPHLVDRLNEVSSRAAVTGKNKQQILDTSISEERRQSDRRRTLEAGEDPFVSEVDPVLIRGFQAWFMKKLPEKAKRCCREGHAMEKICLKQFHQHSEDGTTLGHNSLSIHETPLVASESLEGVADSSDAELIHCTENDPTVRLMPVELKARLSHSTFYEERERVESNLGFKAWEHGEPVCVELEAESAEFSKWIPLRKEGFQLLHHVAVRDLRKGLIIIGDHKKIMFGAFVTCKDETVESCRAILKDLFDRALRPFCKPVAELDLPEDKIARVIQSREMKPIGLTMESFTTACFVWRKLRLEKSLPLPLPPCNRILPCNHSLWNNEKGASDATTSLFWNCKAMTASWGRSQTVALGKFFQPFAVVLHRFNHIATAESDLNFHASPLHCRNSRNRHWPFHKTLDVLVRDHLVKQANRAGGDDVPAQNMTDENSVPSTPPRTQRANPRCGFSETRNCVSVTGGTPGKGRPKFPKNKTREWHADQQRLFNCRGPICRVQGNQQRGCCICNTKTSFACAGCKRWHCFDKSRDSKIKTLINNESEVVEFLNGVRPPETLDIAGFCPVVNSCYHVQHHNAIRKARRIPLTSVEESPVEESPSPRNETQESDGATKMENSFHL